MARMFDMKYARLWIGFVLLVFGGSGAQGLSERAAKDGLAWSPVAALVLFPICCVGAAMVVVATRRIGKAEDHPPTHEPPSSRVR